MIRRLRIWIDTRWFMKHWQVAFWFARHMAVQRERHRLERKATP